MDHIVFSLLVANTYMTMTIFLAIHPPCSIHPSTKVNGALSSFVVEHIGAMFAQYKLKSAVSPIFSNHISHI